jgi:hypothetical protein
VRPPVEFWYLLGIALMFFAVLAGIALIVAAGGFE